MSITERIAASFGRLRSLLSKKEKMMSDQTVIENNAATATPDASTLSPLESFANEVAMPATSSAPILEAPASAVGTGSEVLPAPTAADAAGLTQQSATPDILANGSATAGPSSVSEVGDRADSSLTGVNTDAVSQEINASVKDFAQAFNFVESGVEKLGVAAKDELIALARKYM